MPPARSIYRAQRGILCGLLLCRCRRSRSLVAAAGSLDPLSVASSASICCCRQSSLQNGVSPLHIHARARTDQQPERRILANLPLLVSVLAFDSYLYMKMSLFPPRCRRHRKQAAR